MERENKETRQEGMAWVPPAEETENADASSVESVQEERTKELEQKAAEAHDKYLRTYADFENYRKRTQRDLADFRKYANEQLASELLPVVDHLELALGHASEAGNNTEGIVQGVELVLKQFLDVLAKVGVTPFAAEGEPFDPVQHEAVMQTAADDAPENTVVQVIQKGYRYQDKVLRHAKVGVAKRQEGETEEGNGDVVKG